MMQTPYPSASLSPARRSLLQRLRRGAAGLMLLAAAAWTGAACSSSELEDLDGTAPGTSGSGVPAYVSLRLTAPSPSSALKRANPAGGETGDGSETGQDNENAVRTVTAFFYPGTGDFSSLSNSSVLAIVHFGEDQVYPSTVPTADGEAVYATESVEVDLEPGAYKVVAIVNGGEEVEGWGTTAQIDLNYLRQRARTSAWTAPENGGSVADYSDFVMTSEQEATITIEEGNSNPETPAETKIFVERLAARVDYCPGGDFTLTKGTDGANYSGTITIEGLALANNLAQGEYYFKRVTDQSTITGADPVYLGAETTDPATGLPSNYVLDPWTHLKLEENKDQALFPVSPEPGSTGSLSAEGLYAPGHYFPTDCQNNAAFWSANAVQGIALDADANGDTYYLAAYTMENTLPADAPLEYYATAAVFKAKFAPAGLDGYEDGYTFFDYAGVLYVDLEDLMRTYHGAAYEASQTAIVGAAGWAAVRTAASSLTANDPTGYREWLIAQVPADGFGTPDPANLTWAYYMDTEIGYSKTADAGAVTDRNNKVTQNELIQYGVRTFYRSRCYYTWFLKHAEDGDDQAQGVMEYGVVRNNIYKLKVTSVRDLGGMVPEEDNQLRVSVYVNDWQLLNPERLHM